ncbi:MULTISPECIES: HPP family protein [unclassified Ruegeria]|uniref:CBS domain-containing protein n=1 Tax=unclassified Ruegeria TaxID=2625375 RepID=UPI00148818A1|nr:MULTISPECIES: CBS domain-containing protein [unclassified Ruegeria]
MVPPEIQKTIHPDDTVAKAFEIIRDSRARFLPVVSDDGSFQGVFTAPTLIKMILPQAARIGVSSETARVPIANLSFMDLTKEDFGEQIKRLNEERVGDHMSEPANIPVTAPDTPVMEGIFLIHKFKRHVFLVEPDTNHFVGTVSPNSLIEHALS